VSPVQMTTDAAAAGIAFVTESARTRDAFPDTVEGVLGIVLPQRCLVCGAGGRQLCGRCRARLAPVPPPLCDRCGAPTAWPVARCRECSGRRLAFSRARAAVLYDGDVRLLVAAWKEGGLRRLAEEAGALVAEHVPRPDADVVTFVPPDGARGLRRGHHPAERLAAAVAAAWGIPSERLLERRGSSRRQRGLPLADRRRNVANAFRPRGDPPGRVLLVDDVYTSGATVAAAARALRRAGAESVEVVTFARVVRVAAVGLAPSGRSSS
jgi:predicted amidophosphoribosyltransferase